MISVIVPVRGEAPPASEFLERLRRPGVETIVAADAATAPATLNAYRDFGARILTPDGARGARLGAAAAVARGAILLFLHADTLLPETWATAVSDAVEAGAAAGAFRLRFSGGGGRMAWVAFWANLRTAWTRVPYGDQALFATADAYRAVGGHRPWPLLEDVDLARRLRDHGRMALLPLPVLTSPRRYLERGVLRTVLMNWRILWRFRKGIDPETLAREYRKQLK